MVVVMMMMMMMTLLLLDMQECLQCGLSRARLLLQHLDQL
jgi:hypothetical protein